MGGNGTLIYADIPLISADQIKIRSAEIRFIRGNQRSIGFSPDIYDLKRR